MALSRPRKKKVAAVILIIIVYIKDDLDNNVEGTLYEVLMSQIAQADALLFTVETWQQEHEDAWTAFEAIHDFFESETANQDLESLSADFGDKLSRL